MPATCSGTVTGMLRTQADRARRRALADAASGSIQRAHVVLYACLPEGDTDKILTELRAYAAARDWIVADELIDRTSVTEPTDGRPKWPRLKELIETGRAQGIVTPMRRMCGLRETDQAGLDTWLADQRAFVVSTWDPRARLTPARP